MGYSQKSVSLIHVFKSTQIKTALWVSTLCWLLCLLLFNFILSTLIQKMSSTQLSTIATQLNQHTDITPTLQNYQTQLEAHIKNSDAQRISIIDEQYDIRLVIEQDQRSNKTTQWINTFFFKTTLTQHFHNNLTQGIISLTPSAQNYMQFYYLIFATFTLYFTLLPFIILILIHNKTAFLYRNIYPIIHVMHKFNQSNISHRRAPYSEIKEFQIFNESFNTLLNKLESTKQNLNDQKDDLNFQANHDVLTGLPNRHQFQQILFKEFNHQNNQHLVLLFIDNNKFKAINDTYGHQAGDAVLKEMAIRLRNTLRENDFIARLGGDEFAVVLNNIIRLSDLQQICENLIQSCEAEFIFNQQEISISFSIGACYAYHAQNIEDLLHQADQAMYKAKHSAWHWHIYSPDHKTEHYY
jgi:diguanylate cyclase